MSTKVNCLIYKRNLSISNLYIGVSIWSEVGIWLDLPIYKCHLALGKAHHYYHFSLKTVIRQKIVTVNVNKGPAGRW